MKPLPAALEAIKPSGIRVMADLAGKKPNAIHLEIGEPDFPTAGHIVEAAHRAAMQGFTKYTANAGFESLRSLIAEKVWRCNGIKASIDEITVTTGAVCGITSSLFAVAEAGDEVLLPNPGWPNYRFIVTTAGCIPITYPLRADGDFLPDLDELETLVTPRTKVLLLGFPANPTGAVLPRELLSGLMEFASQHDLYVISDEVYEAFVFEGEHGSPARLDADGRVASVMGFSKTYAMTGWRVGYVVAPRRISRLVTKLQEAFSSCACSVSQKAAEAALSGPQDCVAIMREAYRKRRDLAVGILRRYGVEHYVPHGAFYLWADISRAGRDSNTFTHELLEKCGVAVAPGCAFGDMGEGHIRVSLASSDQDLLRGLTSLCQYMESLAAKNDRRQS